MQIDGVKLDTAVAPTNEISQPIPSKSQWLKSLIANAPKNIREHLDEHLSKYLIAIMTALVVYLWTGYHYLDKQSVAFNTKIEFLEKKFTESEASYKERVEKEGIIAKFINNYNKKL
jgi:hypothetical protein